MPRSNFGVTTNPRRASLELLAAARAVVASLGYELLDDGEAAGILRDHAEKLRRYGITGKVETLRTEVPSSPVEGELPLEAADIAAALAFEGLPIKVGA
jgi:hypothetical protein